MAATDFGTKVMTAPLALIKFNSKTIGKMKNVRITEQIRRGRVSGIGRLNPEELPAIEWSGSLSCSSYAINFNKLANELQVGTFRNAASVDAWASALMLQEGGLTIEILRKVKKGQINSETGMVETELKTFAQVTGAFVSREGFDVQEGQIAGRDTEFEYLEPVLYNPGT